MAKVEKILIDNMTSISASTIGKHKSIVLMTDDLVVIWGEEKISRQPVRHHDESKSHGEHVLIVEEEYIFQSPYRERVERLLSV